MHKVVRVAINASNSLYKPFANAPPDCETNEAKDLTWAFWDLAAVARSSTTELSDAHRSHSVKHMPEESTLQMRFLYHKLRLRSTVTLHCEIRSLRSRRLQTNARYQLGASWRSAWL